MVFMPDEGDAATAKVSHDFCLDQTRAADTEVTAPEAIRIWSPSLAYEMFGHLRKRCRSLSADRALNSLTNDRR